MIAVFYDRKNRCCVGSDQLMTINLVETSLVIDNEGAAGEWQGRKKQKAFIKEDQIADLGYKSDKCPTSQNWDKHTTLNDLVFLRLQERPRCPTK